MAAIPFQREIEYPSSDGRPMAETDIHVEVIADSLFALKSRYLNEPDVYVAGNNLLYYVQGDPRFSVSPDVMVVRGVPKRLRETYLLWAEGKAPCFVVEATSKSTKKEDLNYKKDLYERLGVEEYFLFDPREEYLHPRLKGFRLERGRYQAIPPEPDGALLSRTTSLRLLAEGQRLRFVDTATGERLLWPSEERQARQFAEERARASDERNRTLEEENARLRRTLGLTD
jgi:Uma2 family endonuclease